MRKFLVFGTAIVTALVAVLVALAFIDTRQSASPEWSYSPETFTEAEMQASLKPASADLVKAWRKVPVVRKDVMLASAAKRIYVATKDVVIGRVDEPITIILSPEVRWTQGQLGKVVLLRVSEVTPQGVESGAYIFTDPMCHAEFVGMAVPGICTSVEAQRPSTMQAMTSHMRRPTEAELKKWLGENYIANETHFYYVATSDFVAAPEYRFDDGTSTTGTTGIFMPPGVQVVGGQLGYMDLYQISSDGGIAHFIGDTLCFLHDSPYTWSDGGDAGKPNYGKPATFAPQEELKRVSACKR